MYKIAFLNDYTAKSDVKLIKAKSKIYNALLEYKKRSEVEMKERGLVLSAIRLDRAIETLPISSTPSACRTA